MTEDTLLLPDQSQKMEDIFVKNVTLHDRQYSDGTHAMRFGNQSAWQTTEDGIHSYVHAHNILPEEMASFLIFCVKLHNKS
jgi:hypothetical protein